MSEQVSEVPVVAAAIQVSDEQITRDTANAAVEDSAIAQATAEVAGNTALEAEANAETAAEVAVVSAEIGTEAAVSAEEAKQDAGEALSEVGRLREELLSRLDSIHALVSPPEEPQEPANGVNEVVLDDGDIGESGLEPASRSRTTVSGDNSGDSESSRTPARKSAGFRRGRR